MLALSRVQLALFSDASESTVSSDTYSFTSTGEIHEWIEYHDT